MESTQVPKVDKLPFIPTEQEIDLLIAHCGKSTSTALQMLKETGMRIGELEKYSNGRILPLSEKLIGMLNKLPHKHSQNG